MDTEERIAVFLDYENLALGARDLGIAFDFGELVAGYTCAAAAVRGASGVLLGSVAVSGPTARFAREPERQAVTRALRATAARVGRQPRGLG